MLAKKLLLSAVLATGLLGAVAAPLPAMAAVDVYVRQAPPPPREERIPEARRGYVWAPGYWNYHGNRHVWTKGHWERERHGHVYRPTEWVERDGRWHMKRGGWDRDGDGVPNNRDSRPDNPNRR